MKTSHDLITIEINQWRVQKHFVNFCSSCCVIFRKNVQQFISEIGQEVWSYAGHVSYFIRYFWHVGDSVRGFWITDSRSFVVLIGVLLRRKTIPPEYQTTSRPSSVTSFSSFEKSISFPYFSCDIIFQYCTYGVTSEFLSR